MLLVPIQDDLDEYSLHTSWHFFEVCPSRSKAPEFCYKISLLYMFNVAQKEKCKLSSLHNISFYLYWLSCKSKQIKGVCLLSNLCMTYKCTWSSSKAHYKVWYGQSLMRGARGAGLVCTLNYVSIDHTQRWLYISGGWDQFQIQVLIKTSFW